MYVCMYVRMKYTDQKMNKYIDVFTFFMYVCCTVCMYVWMYVCMYVCVYVCYGVPQLWLPQFVEGACSSRRRRNPHCMVCMHTLRQNMWMYVCMYVCMYVTMYVCIYITVESKRPPWKHFNSMRHDRHLMQRWMPIEQHLCVCMYVCMYECLYVCMRYFAMYVMRTTSLSIMCLSTISPTRKFIAAFSLSAYNRAIT